MPTTNLPHKSQFILLYRNKEFHELNMMKIIYIRRAREESYREKLRREQTLRRGRGAEGGSRWNPSRKEVVKTTTTIPSPSPPQPQPLLLGSLWAFTRNMDLPGPNYCLCFLPCDVRGRTELRFKRKATVSTFLQNECMIFYRIFKLVVKQFLLSRLTLKKLGDCHSKPNFATANIKPNMSERVWGQHCIRSFTPKSIFEMKAINYYCEGRCKFTMGKLRPKRCCNVIKTNDRLDRKPVI